MAAPTRALKRWLAALRNDNAAGEYYLTDVVASAVGEGIEVVGVARAAARPRCSASTARRSSPTSSAATSARAAERLMAAGVRLADPARFDQRGELRCGSDVEIDVGCIFEGERRARRRRSHRRLLRAAGTRASPPARRSGPTPTSTARRSARASARARIVGPYARLRGGAVLGADVHVGNFVEIKNSTLGDGAKANHLAYLGDSDVGERVNYGAGSITANYDGANKHRTTIGADAHIGSNCVLVAPVVIGAGATIGGGSTINKDAPAGELTVARARQATLRGWKRPVKR